MSENERLDQIPEEELNAAPAKEKKSKEEKAADKKAKEKAAKKAKGNRIVRWFREMKSELKKVQWPTKKQTVNNTAIVIACVLIVGLFIWVFDFVATSVIDLLISLLG